MIRFLPYIVELALLVFCLIEAITTPADEVRNLDKTLWILLIIFVPLVGGIAWLVAGRPQVRRSSTQWRMGDGFAESSRPRPASGSGTSPRSRSMSPDDDPAFLASIHVEQEQTLKKWEDDLRAREARLREEEQPRQPPGDGTSST
jgi:hypothetical protein